MSKPSSSEEEFFAREEIEKKYKLAAEQAAKRKAAEAEAQKQLHFMKCPKCGNDLATIHFREVEIDRCFHCHGTWLDAGELEKLAGQDKDRGVLSSIVNVFRRSNE